jgi:hypothetical protein
MASTGKYHQFASANPTFHRIFLGHQQRLLWVHKGGNARLRQCLVIGKRDGFTGRTPQLSSVAKKRGGWPIPAMATTLSKSHVTPFAAA